MTPPNKLLGAKSPAPSSATTVSALFWPSFAFQIGHRDPSPVKIPAHCGESEIAINLEAPIHLAALFIPLLAGRPGACIVNISSGLGFVPLAGMPVYCATKAAIHSFSLSLRAQAARLGIDVQEVVPPAVDTELNAAGRTARPAAGRGMAEVGPFVASVLEELVAGHREIGFGYTKALLTASRAELDGRFAAMNGLAAR